MKSIVEKKSEIISDEKHSLDKIIIPALKLSPVGRGVLIYI